MRFNFKGLVLIFYIWLLIILAIYSYAHIDLNLTLSANDFYQKIQQALIQLGYFNRQLSTLIFILILGSLFLFQLHFLQKARRKKISESHILKLSIVIAIILVFSYPAFSHDIFNYIFDARLIVKHHVNPWQFTALDFPDDLWTRFMRWTHRTYPYGPVWLAFTIPVYKAGFGKFTITLFLFKLIGAASYLVSLVSIQKILKKISWEKVTLGMVLFATNPLVIIEYLVTSHIDAVMTTFMLLTIYWALEKRKILSWFMLLISAGIKYITIAAAPVLFFWQGKKQSFSKAITYMLILTTLITLVVILFREPLPWYFLTPIALVSLLPHKKVIQIFTIALSLGLLLRYAPFILKGEYTEWVNNIRNWLTIIPLIPAIIYLVINKRSASANHF